MGVDQSAEGRSSVAGGLEEPWGALTARIGSGGGRRGRRRRLVGIRAAVVAGWFVESQGRPRSCG